MIIAAGSLLGGRYRLDRQLGKGAFAQVYLASDARLKRRVAVKLPESDLIAQPDLRLRFESALERSAEIDHANILGLYDYGDAEGALYLVTPYVEGGTLAEKLRQQGRLGLQATGDYLAQAAAALDYAHERNLVHGGLSPRDLLLRDNGKRLLIADFGLAQAFGNANVGLTAGQAQANVAYMAPEQFQGTAGRAADIYALGCLLFEMLTGAAPFAGTPEQIKQAKETGTPPSIIERSHGQLPESLQIVIEIALAKRPEDRFRSAGELAAAYQEAITAPVPTASGQVAPRPPETAVTPVQVAQSTVTAAPPPLASLATAPLQATGNAAPPASGALSPAQADAQVLAAQSWAWKIAQSWWVVFPFLTLSLLSWAVFLYVGVRARRVRWLLWGAVYFVALVIVFTFTDTSLAAWTILFAWFGSIGHAAVIARPYLRRLAGIQAFQNLRPWMF